MARAAVVRVADSEATAWIIEISHDLIVYRPCGEGEKDFLDSGREAARFLRHMRNQR